MSKPLPLSGRDEAAQLIALEAQRNLYLIICAAVAYGVGAGLFEAEYDVADEVLVGAVQAQEVA